MKYPKYENLPKNQNPIVENNQTSQKDTEMVWKIHEDKPPELEIIFQSIWPC